MEKNTIVCVTGGAGFIGSSLVKKLLERGYTVHATLRSLGDDNLKVRLLRGLPHASTRLRLFEADVYDPDTFGEAIQGCQFVFHVAHPMVHNSQSSKHKNVSEAAVAAVKSIVGHCKRSGTVKRLIYTASVVAASPLNHDGSCFTHSPDESCWTNLHLPYAYTIDKFTEYTHSKTLAEKEVLSHCGNLEVVSLACGLVGGDSILPTVPESSVVIISQGLGNSLGYQALRFLEELLGKVPLIHVEDVINAHIFCLESSGKISGRYLCASDFSSSPDIASCIRQCCPDVRIAEGFIEDTKRGISWGSSKLKEEGFEYKHNLSSIMEDSLKSAKRIGIW
ncbi:Dihydrokaempferol 4-reductase [Bertholletia excelsa]